MRRNLSEGEPENRMHQDNKAMELVHNRSYKAEDAWRSVVKMRTGLLATTLTKIEPVGLRTPSKGRVNIAYNTLE